MSIQDPEYHRAWYNKNKEKRLAQMKERKDANTERVRQLKLSPCVDCGMTYPPVCMDFDHTGVEKVKNVAALLGHSWDKILSEIAKCELVCANCHRIRTNKRWRLTQVA